MKADTLVSTLLAIATASGTQTIYGSSVTMATRLLVAMSCILCTTVAAKSGYAYGVLCDCLCVWHNAGQLNAVNIECMSVFESLTNQLQQNH